MEALRKLLLGLLLTAQLPVPLLGAAGKVRLAHSGAAGGSADAEARREAAEKMEAKCEELLGLQPDAIAQLLLLEPPTDGRPAGWRPLDEAMRCARDACVALGSPAVVSEIVEFMNAMLDEAAPLSAMAHATPPYDRPRLGGPYEGTVCLIDTPGVEASAALGRARGIDALCAAYTSERLRAELLRALAPPPMLKRDAVPRRRAVASRAAAAARSRAEKLFGRAPAPAPALGGADEDDGGAFGGGEVFAALERAAAAAEAEEGLAELSRKASDPRTRPSRRRRLRRRRRPCTARSRPTSSTISPRRDARASHPAAERASAARPRRRRRRRRRPPSR